MHRLNKPVITKETIMNMEDMSFFTHSLIFDDLLIVSQKETNCFVLNSNKGLIIIDAIWPSKCAFDAVISAIADVGWNPNEIKKLVITHGHADHTGCGKWFVNTYNVTAYLSKEDDIFWKNNPVKPNRPETWKDYAINVYISDGDTIKLGDKTIFVYGTPGHTPGCLSFIFPVHENGDIHMAALFGGATPPNDLLGIIQYMKSLDYFVEQSLKHNADVFLTNHTAIDNGLLRIEYSKNRMYYMPNIYILGQNDFLKYCQVFRNLSYDALKNINKF